MPTKKNVYKKSRKGGYASYEVCINNIRRFLKQAAHCELVLLIFDYYGLHPSFKTHLSKSQKTVDEKIFSIQNRLEIEIGNPRFKFRLQVHEFEAFLFSNVAEICAHFNQPEKIVPLRTILSNFQNDPELIDDDPKSAPSKRLEKFFPSFGKIGDGLLIAQKIGIQMMRQRCNRFNKMCNLFDELL